MVDVEIRAVADRRDGLLLALGQTAIASGFTLLRQGLTATTEGAVLTLLVRGPSGQLAQLEASLAGHPLVRRFEAVATDVPLAESP